MYAKLEEHNSEVKCCSSSLCLVISPKDRTFNHSDGPTFFPDSNNFVSGSYFTSSQWGH